MGNVGCEIGYSMLQCDKGKKECEYGYVKLPCYK